MTNTPNNPNASPTSREKAPTLTRKQLLKLGGCTLLSVATAGGILLERNGNQNGREGKAAPEPARPDAGTATIVSHDVTTPPSTSTPEANDCQIYLDPEALRQLAEDDPKGLVEAFQITAEQAPTLEKFAEEYAKRLEMALNAGCTPEEVTDYKEGFVPAMDDKYDEDAALGIYGPSDKAIRSTYAYQSLASAHAATLTRFQTALSINNLTQKIKVVVDMGAENPVVDKGYTTDGRRSITINLHVTDQYGEIIPGENSYDIHGPVALIVDIPKEKGVCTAMIDNTVRNLFDQIAA